MYAIRSYYVVLSFLADAIGEIEDTGLQEEIKRGIENDTLFEDLAEELERGSRITSYNVCYTKLLRGSHGSPSLIVRSSR